jgi:exo-1,4-beta-D-glucosaminidase
VGSQEVLRKEIALDLPTLSSRKVLDLAGVGAKSPIRFVALQLLGSDGETVARNFYWLSSQDDVQDWEASTWFYTPNKGFADLRALRSLPPAKVETGFEVEATGERLEARVTLHNRSDVVAFFLELGVVGKRSGDAVTPILWQDNYVSLLPGEKRTLSAEFAARDLEGDEPALVVTGFNVGQ